MNQMIYTASVKVMRSFDYCHFEVILGSTEPIDLAGVDAMRKEAARLADKAVRQYRVAKVNAAKLVSEKQNRAYLIRDIERIESIDEGERTVSEQAKLKAYSDQQWEASHHYDYDDDWPEEDEQ